MNTSSKTFTSVKNGDTITVIIPETHIIGAARIFLKGRDSAEKTVNGSKSIQSTSETNLYTQPVDVNSLSKPENAVWKPPHHASTSVVGKGEAVAGGDPEYTYHRLVTAVYDQAATGSYRGYAWVPSYGTHANQLDAYVIPGDAVIPIYASEIVYFAQEWPGVTFSLNEIAMTFNVWASYVVCTKNVSVFLKGSKVAEYTELLENGQATDANVFSGLDIGNNSFKVYTLNSETLVDVIVEYDYTERAFPELGMKINNQLKTSEAGWVQIGGQLREIEKIWTKIDGQLREV